MDHVLDGMQVHMEAYLDVFKRDWKSGWYKKYSECPGYYDIKIINDAMNIIRKHIGLETETVNQVLKWFL